MTGLWCILLAANATLLGYNWAQDEMGFCILNFVAIICCIIYIMKEE